MVDEVQTGLGPHRALVRVPAPGRRARRGDHGQGAGQRDAGRGLLGPGRGGGGLRARRPREHLRRAAPGHGRGPGHPGGDGGRGRAGPGPCGRGPACGPAWSGSPGVASVRGAGSPAGRRARPSPVAGRGRAAAARGRPGRQRPAARRAALRPVAAGHRRRDRRGAGHAGRVAGRPADGRRRRPAPTAAEAAVLAGPVRPGTSSTSTTSGRPAWPRCSNWPSGARRAPTGARRPGRGPALREAVEPHPQQHGDGGGGARRPSRLHPGRPRSASTSGSRPRTWPAPWPATTASSAPGCSTTPTLVRMAAALDEQRLRRAGGQPALRPGPSVPGPRRPAHPAPDVRGRSPGRTAGLRRRRQQRVALPGHGGADGGHGSPGGLAGRLRARPRTGRPRAFADRIGRGGIVRVTNDPAEAAAGPTPSTPTCGPRWARRRSGRPGSRPSPASPSTRPWWPRRRPDAVVLHCLPAHRGEEITRRGVRRAPQRGLASGRQPHARHAGHAGLASSGIEPVGTPDRDRARVEPLTKHQRQHRITRLLGDPGRDAARPSWWSCWPTEGVEATQTTVSRDLEELGAVKVRLPGGETAYALPELPGAPGRTRGPPAPGAGGVGGRGRPTRPTWSCCARRPARPMS